MLSIIGRNRAGRVIVRDERDDGSVVLLVCDEFDDAGAVFVPRDPPQNPPPPNHGTFPFPSFVAAIGANIPQGAVTPFELTVDTSGLPSGPIELRMTAFLRRSMQAIDDGVEVVQLSIENAAEWGWSGREPTDLAARIIG